VTGPDYYLRDGVSLIRDVGIEDYVGRGPGIVLTVQEHPVTIARFLTRDEVRELVTALDEWLFDSRPA
jgi:hypothetical protein